MAELVMTDRRTALDPSALPTTGIANLQPEHRTLVELEQLWRRKRSEAVRQRLKQARIWRKRRSQLLRDRCLLS